MVATSLPSSSCPLPGLGPPHTRRRWRHRCGLQTQRRPGFEKLTPQSGGSQTAASLGPRRPSKNPEGPGVSLGIGLGDSLPGDAAGPSTPTWRSFPSEFPLGRGDGAVSPMGRRAPATTHLILLHFDLRGDRHVGAAGGESRRSMWEWPGCPLAVLGVAGEGSRARLRGHSDAQGQHLPATAQQWPVTDTRGRSWLI